MAEEWLTMSVAALGRAIGGKEIGPVELTETFLAAIEAHPFAERIYARTTPDRARAEARAAEARAMAGTRASEVDGVPISWKDLFDTAGVETEAGTALLKGRVPAKDARVLANARAAGLICLGKTHMTELAFSGLGLNPITASPPCVNDHEAVSGGSSSGAATSVAVGLAACGIGSDTGGSVRIPSAWNDLVGLKTTPGRLSLDGVVPLCARFDTVGPLCRSVGDAALMLAALEGGRPADLTGAELTGRRFLVLQNVAFDEIREAPREGFERAITRIGNAGAEVVRAPVDGLEEAMALSPVVFATEAYGTWRDVIEADPEAMYPEILQRFRGGKDVSGADYVAAWQALDRHRAAWAEAVAGFDAVLTPTCPIIPPNRERLEADSDFFVSENLLTLRNTRIGNLMGLPGLTLPTGIPSAGLQILTPPGSEERLLRIGKALETALA
jgi:aspartyl-tRNA(Asn)/glutamyl-tRNA(Gln) amidotransferase subunit A